MNLGGFIMPFSAREQERIAKAELITQIANDAKITPAQANTAYETIIKTYLKKLNNEGYFVPAVTRVKRTGKRPRRPVSRGRFSVLLLNNSEIGKLQLNEHDLAILEALKRISPEKMVFSKEQIDKSAEMDEVKQKERALLAHVRANMKYKFQDLIDECDPKQPWTEDDLAWFNAIASEREGL